MFASLVIVSHVPELVDGDRGREVLTRLTGTTSFGELAVDGFFVISGFLITASYANGRSALSYLFKRAARIYPGFLAASLFSLLVVAPLAGACLEYGAARAALGAGIRMILLARPTAPGAFADQHHADRFTALNGATWTIQYEFLCYLLVIALGFFGLLRRPGPLVAATLLCLAVDAFLPDGGLAWLSRPMLLPAPAPALFRLVGMFLAGASFHALRHHLRFSPLPISASAVGLAITIRIAPLSGFGVAAFGGYLIFAAATLGGSTRLARVNDRNDISYGVYLYAWPIQRLLMRHMGLTNPLLLGLLTWSLAVACGWASWLLVERPAMRWARKRLATTDHRIVQHSAIVSRPYAAAATGNGTEHQLSRH